MRVRRTTGWMVGALGLLGSVAIAAENEPPCLAEIQRLCGMIPGTGAYAQNCLGMHTSELSPRCRKHLGDLTDTSVTVRSSCAADLSRYCADTPHAAGEDARCLLGHRDALSQACRKTVDDISAKSIE